MMPLKNTLDARRARRAPEKKIPPREPLVEKYKCLGIGSVAAAAAMMRRQEAR